MVLSKSKMAVGCHLENIKLLKLYKVSYTGFETSVHELCKMR